jgi:hypothetical protein
MTCINTKFPSLVVLRSKYFPMHFVFERFVPQRKKGSTFHKHTKMTKWVFTSYLYDDMILQAQKISSSDLFEVKNRHLHVYSELTCKNSNIMVFPPTADPQNKDSISSPTVRPSKGGSTKISSLGIGLTTPSPTTLLRGFHFRTRWDKDYITIDTGATARLSFQVFN